MISHWQEIIRAYKLRMKEEGARRKETGASDSVFFGGGLCSLYVFVSEAAAKTLGLALEKRMKKTARVNLLYSYLWAENARGDSARLRWCEKQIEKLRKKSG